MFFPGHLPEPPRNLEPQQFMGARLAGTALSWVVYATLWVTFAKLGRHDPCPHGGAFRPPRTIQELRQMVQLCAPPCAYHA